jgi:hypothetical protein
VLYALDEPADALAQNELERLQALSVEELLAFRVLRPRYAAVHRFSHDVFAVARYWREQRCLPHELPRPGACAAACGRAADTLMPCWAPLDAFGVDALAAAPPGTESAVETLASGYLQQRSGEDEATVFRSFFEMLAACFSAGVLMKPRT